MALWSPKGHAMAIVVDNDLYYMEDVGEAGQSRSLKRLTSTGQQGVIFNGVADWLYEGKRDLCSDVT